MKAEWAQRFGAELVIDEVAQQEARVGREAAGAGAVMEWVSAAVAGIDKAAFTRADLIEALGAAMPVTIDDTGHGPRWVVETLADAVGMRITEDRQPHEREGHDRFTAAPIIAEEQALYELIAVRDERAALPAETVDAVVGGAGLSGDQGGAIGAIATSPWLIQTLSAPAGAGKTTSLRALREAAHRGGKSRVLVAAPTGKAADVALAEGAGDVGGTIAAALKALREARLRFDSETLLVIDEAGMVGTAALRELLAAASSAGTKTVLVGDGRQLSPVKARGGMFTQLCADLPWAQHLSEVWRMHDAGERAASLGVRDGDGGVLDDAVEWYRDHDRLHTGDPVAMAQDAFDAWMREHDPNSGGGGDSLLIADRWEIADALNERIHRHRVEDGAETVNGARRHRIGAGDVVISRRNDPTIEVFASDDRRTPVTDAPVRNGQRWNVIAVDAEGDRIAARRIGDNALTVFDGEYLHTHVHHGYAVTVHAAQGATAERCHAVLSTTGRRRAAYVAMTRGRESNTVYLYDRVAGEGDHEHSAQPEPGVHEARRGDDQDAAGALKALLSRDDTARTVADTAAGTDRDQLPDQVAGLLDTRGRALEKVRSAHELGAEVDWLAQIGGISPGAVCHKTGTDTLERLVEDGLDQDQRGIVAGLVGTIYTVQSLHVDAEAATDKPALLGAVTACTQAEDALTIVIPGTEAARRDAVGYSDGTEGLHSAADVLAEFDTLAPDVMSKKSRFFGAFIIVDDADHLHPVQLQRLARHAHARGSKLLLVTTDTDPPRPGPSKYLTDAAAAHLP
ncbi:MAG: AAA family ATPase, partial [Mycobacterium sp.]|nr:AAA family ATPase [Mycobacterium sp.]